jgi:hypothetical protein
VAVWRCDDASVLRAEGVEGLREGGGRYLEQSNERGANGRTGCCGVCWVAGLLSGSAVGRGAGEENLCERPIENTLSELLATDWA